MIYIRDFKIREEKEFRRISAAVNHFELFYTVPLEQSVQRLMDPFVSAAFFPAMIKGQDIKVESDVPVSSHLLPGLVKLQEIFRCWYPGLSSFTVSCETADSQPLKQESVSFFPVVLTAYTQPISIKTISGS